MEYEITQIDNSTWTLSEGFVRFFLIAGAKKVLAGEIKGEPREMFGTKILAFDVGCDILLVGSKI